MESKGSTGDRLRLAWVSQISVDTLDAATWIDTTRELRRQGVDVTLIIDGPTGKGTHRGVETTNIKRPSIYFLGQVIFFLRVLRFLLPRLRSFDVILFHQMAAIWLLPIRLLGRHRPLLVMDTRDMSDVSKSLKVRLRMAWYDLTINLAARFADGQTAITSRMAELVRIPQKQLWGIWPSGVDVARFASASKARHWPYGDEPIRLVYIGVFLAKRNLVPLCRAVVQANTEGMSFVVSLCGDGASRPDLEAVAAEGKGAIHIERPIPHEEIPHLLARAHIGVTSLPEVNDIKYEASSPIKLFEYMAAGLPVLATSNKCHTDVVGDGEYAFWADGVTEEIILGALRGIWAERFNLSTLGQEAQADAQEWTYTANAAKLKAALIFGFGRHANTQSQMSRIGAESS